MLKITNGTTAIHALCLSKGASILRVHDVKEAVECVKLITSPKPIINAFLEFNIPDILDSL